MEGTFTRNQIISELARSAHGKLEEYIPIGRKAIASDTEFFHHLIAWNRLKGQIDDTKIALPVLALTTPNLASDYKENALAHLALLDPRKLVKAIRFSKQARQQGTSGKHALRGMVIRYLAVRQANREFWNKTAVNYRSHLHELYALMHIPRPKFVGDILFAGKYPENSVFQDISQLRVMPAAEAAGTILTHRLPSLLIQGVLGDRLKKEPDIALAMINRMTATELVTHSRLLDSLGVKTNPALRGAYKAAMEKAGTSKRATLKTSRAAEAVEDEGQKAMLRALQEKQIDNLSNVEGDWLLLVDKSGSMSVAIEIALQIAAVLARFAKGKVHLVFFDTAPRYIDATGKTLEQLKKETRRITAGGGTSIGCGLAYAIENHLNADGICIVSDAAENTPPFFAAEYSRWIEKTNKVVPVYLYRCGASSASTSDKDLARTMKQAGIDLQDFDLRTSKVDYYSLTNLVQTMRTNRYGLADEILATPLLMLDQVFRSVVPTSTGVESVVTL